MEAIALVVALLVAVCIGIAYIKISYSPAGEGAGVNCAIFCIALLAQSSAHAADKFEPDPKATAQVAGYLWAKDCPGAVKALNAALKDKKPEILLLAGNLFEEGMCVKVDLDQATKYYLRAHEAGHPSAAPRMISMQAKSDPATALWWAISTGQPVPRACFSEYVEKNEPDAFVAALNQWPAGRLAACVYTIGVVNRIRAQVEFPPEAQRSGVFGIVNMQLVPAEGKVTWKKVESGSVPVSGVAAPEYTERHLFKNTFLQYLQGVSDNALKEYTKPAGIDPAWRMDVQFHFSYR